jgi:secreted PhoX family phosphatase
VRRRFLAQTAALAGAAFTADTLSILAAHAAGAGEAASGGSSPADYGPLAPTPDIDGHVVLALPQGFRYSTFSRTGETYASGRYVPRSHDGMACFAAAPGMIRLIRNHELRNVPHDFTLGIEVAGNAAYDASAAGGCMALDFDMRTKRLVRQFPVLGGTIVNCAGGYAYADAGWITCEETTAGVNDGFEKPHGYAFFVPASAQSTARAVPLTALGRFAHEAAVADVNGVIYLTEDAGTSSGFYRFTPELRGDLTRGRLQMLAIRGAPRADLHAGGTIGTGLPVHWVAVDDADPALEHGAPSCFMQGRARGGAAFERLEGIYRAEDGRSMYFVATTGGTARALDGRGYGQIWRYTPALASGRADELTLVFDSPEGSVLESPDNLCVTPRGALLLCEDDAIGDADTHALAGGIANVNRLVGLTRDGRPFAFAVNLHNASELAGACFSPDGEILFVNLFGDARSGSGMSCAIWGPWARGPL